MELGGDTDAVVPDEDADMAAVLPGEGSDLRGIWFVSGVLDGVFEEVLEDLDESSAVAEDGGEIGGRGRSRFASGCR